ncbi:hypothetical protein MMC28_007594 [Mycoblastus sanguinarius]|nr:hypothetical protein [Mycoblastus sanguinarius]
MTLTFSGFGHLIQHSFGANEISSMLTIGKAIGSVVTRQSDASIFGPLAVEYGIRVTQIPSWLSKVQFDRKGTILGDRQRQVPVPNTLANVDIFSIEGVATFLILILRYVESPTDIIEDVEDLLRGDYDIISGGTLQLRNAPVVAGEAQKKSLPFSLRGALRSFINGVIDADAVSPQRHKCMVLMGQLMNLLSSNSSLVSSLKYVKMEHQKLLELLLSSPPPDGQVREKCFNTLSAGTAMIGLAAAANGANVIVECVRESGTTQLDVPSRLSTYSQDPLIVRLWLMQPPTTLIHEIRSDFKDFLTNAEDDPNLHSLPVYGGMLEIATHVSTQLGCDLSPEEALALWHGGLSVGREALWTAKSTTANKHVSFAFANEFLESELVASIGPLADGYYRVPRGDRRHQLARKAACVLHQIFNYSDYRSFGELRFKTSLDLIIIALFVGSLESLISNRGKRLLSYAWMIDCKQTLGVAERCACNGLSHRQLVIQAARVWGGVTHVEPLDLDQPGSSAANDVDVVGMVCPQIIFLCNIVLDPKEMARIGIAKGFMSWFEGSSPILPREQDSGFILAGKPPYSRPYLCIGADKPLPPELVGDDDNEEAFDALLFSAEPSKSSRGVLTIVLCVWHLGDLMMVLDPFVVLTNLLACRSICPPEKQYRSPGQRLPNTTTNAIHLTPDFLQWLECGFTVTSGFCIIDVGGKLDWQIVAAGVSASSRVMLISDSSEVASIHDSRGIFLSPCTIILGGEKRATSKVHGSYVESRNNTLSRSDELLWALP